MDNHPDNPISTNPLGTDDSKPVPEEAVSPAAHLGPIPKGGWILQKHFSMASISGVLHYPAGTLITDEPLAREIEANGGAIAVRHENY